MKRSFYIIIAVLLLSLFCCGVAEEIYPVITDYVVALVDREGENLLPENSFQEVFFLGEGNLYVIGSKENYYLMRTDGNMISAVPMDMANVFGDTIIYRRNSLYGAMNLEREILVEPEWTQLTSNQSGGFLAMDGNPFDETADEIFYIDSSGEINPTGCFTVGGLKTLSDDRMAIIATDGRYGYVDGQGNLTLPIEWLYAGSFRNNMAVVTGDEGMGILDVNGNVLLEPIYRFIEYGESILAVLNDQGELKVYSAGGLELRFTLQISDGEIAVIDDYIAVFDAMGSYLYNNSGERILTASAEAVFTAGLNGQIIVSDGEWGEACQWIVNSDGSVASEKYQRIMPLKGNRYAFITMSGAEYYSNALESLQKSWNYESVRYGLMDDEGKTLLPAEYLEIQALDRNRFLLISDTGVFFTDENGAIIREWTMAEDELSNSEAADEAIE